MLLITGKTGTGKTSLFESIDKTNVYIIDDINREVWINKGQRYYEFVESNFEGCVDDQKILTKKLGTIVFSDPSKLELLSSFIIPNIIKYFKALPDNAIVEYAPYMDHEEDLKDIFDKVILITKEKPVLDNKFDYLKRKTNPIKNESIKADYVIDNNDLEKGKIELQRILKENDYV